MKTSLKYRECIPDSRRVIVKIGSRVLAQKTGRPDVRRMKALIGEMAALARKGYDLIIVTSGAIAAGMEALGMKERPTRLPDLQMCAAVGQARLMNRYAELFGARGLTVGQVLLTHDDFHHKIRMTNARRTMENMIRHRVIPIINENDVVADEEIKADMSLGDNDFLASLLVRLLRADLLVLLSTVDGVREWARSGTGRRIRYIESFTPKTFEVVTGEKNALSKGGMGSKLQAARSAASAGCNVLIANGRQDGILGRIMLGHDVGTLVLASTF